MPYKEIIAALKSVQNIGIYHGLCSEDFNVELCGT